MLRWARIDAQDQGVANFGLPMTVKPTFRNEDELWGFTVAVHNREGDVLTELSVRMDNETTTRREHVGRGADGFPLLKGEVLEVEGKNLEIRKIDENPVDERLRSVIKSFCQALLQAINRYYAFGSPFVDDSQ
ncbi:hypothetical protein WJX73_006021 [Symbiochloris irregularis]|uniref:Uncharacterized protein n=1 Tax=Symbiochloris irregularis TaxID=706552 RepID=A0AAW1P6F0_9CHLO